MKTNKLQISLRLIILCFVLSSNSVQSQMSGNYTIGGVGSDYEDFDDAISALTNDGIGGDVQFLVEPGDYYNVSIVDIENDGYYQIQFKYNGTLNDSASLIGQLKVIRTVDVSFKGFTIYPMENQEISCIWINESNSFLLDSCKVLNLYNNQFDYDEGLILMEFPWDGATLVADITNCIINSENETMVLDGKKGKVNLRNSHFTGFVFNRFEYVRANYENNIFQLTDDLFNSVGQTFNGNTFYFESIFTLKIRGDVFNNVFHCDVELASGSVIENVFYGSIEMKWMNNANFRSNIVFGDVRSIYSHGIKIISNYFFSNCRMNNDNTRFGNNFVFDTVTFTHGPGQYIFNNNFNEDAHLEFHWTSGIIKNNNINTLWIEPPQLQEFTIENNNFINPDAGNISSFGENAHFYNPLYEGDSSLYSKNPLLIAKGADFYSFFNFDIDSVPRKNPCTIGANEICFNWEVDEVNLNCGDSLCLDLCIDSLQNMFWSPSFLFPDSTATRPLIFPEDSLTIYLNYADGGIFDSLIVNTEPSNPIAFATFSSDGLKINFENKSRCADKYYWDFGDGEFSEEESPVHEYAGYGSYQCELTAFNELGSSNYTLSIVVVANLENQMQHSPIILYPNPTNKILRIDSEIIIENILLTDMNGQLLLHKKVKDDNNYQLNLESLSKGIYLLRITTDHGLFIRKVIKFE